MCAMCAILVYQNPYKLNNLGIAGRHQIEENQWRVSGFRLQSKSLKTMDHEINYNEHILFNYGGNAMALPSPNRILWQTKESELQTGCMPFTCILVLWVPALSEAAIKTLYYFPVQNHMQSLDLKLVLLASCYAYWNSELTDANYVQVCHFKTMNCRETFF